LSKTWNAITDTYINDRHTPQSKCLTFVDQRYREQQTGLYNNYISSKLHNAGSNSPMQPEDQRSSSQSVPAAEHRQAAGSEATYCELRWDCSECTSATEIHEN